MSENNPQPQMGEPITFTGLDTIQTPQDLAAHMAANPDAYHPGLVPHIEAYLDRSGVTMPDTAITVASLDRQPTNEQQTTEQQAVDMQPTFTVGTLEVSSVVQPNVATTPTFESATNTPIEVATIEHSEPQPVLPDVSSNASITSQETAHNSKDDSYQQAIQQATINIAKTEIDLRRREKRGRTSDQAKDESPEISSSVIQTIEKLQAMPPKEAREYLHRLKTELPGSYDLRDYKEFVAYQRDLRKKQSDYIASQMKTLPADATEQQRREVFLDAVSYSPDIGARVLRQLTPTDNMPYSSRKLLSETEVVESSQSKEAFNEKISQILAHQPAVILEQLPLLQPLLPKQSLQDALYRSVQVQPEIFRTIDIRLPVVLDRIFDTPEQKKTFLMAAIQQIKSLGPDVIARDELRSLLTDQEVSNIVDVNVRTGESSLAYQLESIYKNGLITDEQVAQYLKTPDAYAPYASLLSRCAFVAQDTLYSRESELPAHIRQMAKDQVRSFVSDVDTTSPYDLLSLHTNNVIDNETLKQELLRRFTTVNSSIVFDVAAHNQDVKEFFSEEDIKKAVHDIMDTNDQYLLSRELEHIFAFDVLDPEDLKTIIGLLTPNGYLNNLDNCKNILGYNDEQTRDAALSAFNLLPDNSKEYHLQTIADYCTAQEMQDIIVHLAQSGITIDQYTLTKDAIKDKLADFDVTQLPDIALQAVLQQSELNPYALINSLRSFEELVNIDSAKQKAAEAIQMLTPLQKLQVIFLDDRFFDPTTISSVVKEQLQNPECESYLLNDMLYATVWVRYVDSDTVKSFISNVSAKNLATIATNIDVFSRYISIEEHKNITLRYINADPASAFENLSTLSALYQDIDQMTIVASVNTPRGIPKIDSYLQDVMSRAIAHDREAARQLLLTEASLSYQSMALLQSRQGTEYIQTIVQNENISNAQSIQLLESVATLMTLDTTLQIQNLTSVQQVNEALVRSVASYVGSEIQNISEAAQNDKVTSAARILGVYMQQHVQSKNHKELAATILEQTANGTFNTWKFGTQSEEAMQSLKDNGLLPKNLSYDQLLAWSKDESTQLQDTFSVEAGTASAALVDVLQNNSMYLQEALESAQDTRQAIADIGTQIAETEKQKQIVKNSTDVQLSKDQLDQLQETSDELRKQLISLQIIEDVRAINNITPEDIKAGALIQNDGKKSRSIQAVVKRLRKNLPQAQVFIADQLDAVLDSYADQTGDVQQMSVTDDSDIITTLRVGVEPVGSCQNYRTGELNTSLIGYTDPNTKIIVMRNAKGSQIARAVYRMVSDDQGNPSLHVDTIYTTDSSIATRRAMYAHAIQKAESMGMPVYISALSQDHQGTMQAARSVTGIALTPEPGLKLSSSNSRAPKVYVDAAGGIQDNGQYTITNLNKLTLA